MCPTLLLPSCATLGGCRNVRKWSWVGGRVLVSAFEDYTCPWSSPPSWPAIYYYVSGFPFHSSCCRDVLLHHGKSFFRLSLAVSLSQSQDKQLSWNSWWCVPAPTRCATTAQVSRAEMSLLTSTTQPHNCEVSKLWLLYTCFGVLHTHG